MDSVADGDCIGDKNSDGLVLPNEFEKLGLADNVVQDGEKIGDEIAKKQSEKAGEKLSFHEDVQEGEGDGLVLLDDNGQKLCSLSEPTEFDKVVAAIEDTMIEDEIGDLQLKFVESYHQLTSIPSLPASELENKKKKIFEDYRAGMCAVLEVAVKQVANNFDMMEFLEEIFATPFVPSQSQNKEFEESEIYELLQTMYDLEGFENLVSDYVNLVNSRDILSAVKVTPLRDEEY